MRYDDHSGEETVNLYFLFVATGEVNFTMNAMGFEKYRPVLRKTVASLRQLTAHERQSIGGLRVRLATVKADDTLSSFGARVTNQWSAELTGIVNAVDPKTPLKSDSNLKLAKQERYVQ